VSGFDTIFSAGYGTSFRQELPTEVGILYKIKRQSISALPFEKEVY